MFVESFEPVALKFGHNVWIGPEGENKDFHHYSFCIFYFYKEKLCDREFPL